MKWTKETPTEAGQYWMMAGAAPPIVVSVQPGIMQHPDLRHTANIYNWTGCKWYGPIQPPPFDNP